MPGVSSPPTAVITSISPLAADPQTETVAFRENSYDNDEDGASISVWQWRSNLCDWQGGSILSTQKDPDIPANDLQVGDHTITLWVQDDEGETDTDMCSQTLAISNVTPLVDSLTVTPSSLPPGTPANIAAAAHDRDEHKRYIVGWEIQIDGTNGYSSQITAGAGNLNETADTALLESGTYNVSVRAQDDEGTWSDTAVDTFFVEENSVLELAPENQVVSSEAGSTSFNVSNGGGGSMSWTTQVLSPANSWISITSDSSGTNAGTIICSYTKNSGSERIGRIRVTASGATGSPKDVTITQSPPIVDSPVIDSIQPSSGPTGTQITITGSNFGETQGSGYVTLYNGVNSTNIASWSDTQITCTVPEGAATGSVTVTTDQGTSNCFTFTVQTDYTITATSGEHDIISPSGSVSVGHGANQTFIITPDPGYRVSDVLVDGVSVGAVTTYAFVNVTANRTIEASFELNLQPNHYVIVISDQTWNLPDWQTVATMLATKHSGEIVNYNGDAFPELLRSEIAQYSPEYVCFVAQPNEVTENFVRQCHQMLRELNSDVYGDAIWGIVTGLTSSDALRLASSTRQRQE